MIEIVIIGLAVMVLRVPKLWLSFLPSIIVKNGTNYPKYDEKNYLHNCQTATIEVYCVACQNLPIKQMGERSEPDTSTYAHRLSLGLSLCFPPCKRGIQRYPDEIEILHQVEVVADRAIDLVKRHVPLIDDGDPRW